MLAFFLWKPMTNEETMSLRGEIPMEIGEAEMLERVTSAESFARAVRPPKELSPEGLPKTPQGQSRGQGKLGERSPFGQLGECSESAGRPP